MANLFRSLMPRSDRFFDLFEQHSATLVAGAAALQDLLAGGPDVAANCQRIVDHEHEADAIAREVLLDVRRIFVTPFDRSAITKLISAMDDAIDQMNKTAKTITLYGISAFRPEMQEMGRLTVEAARLTSEAVPLLRSVGTNGGRVAEITEEVVRIEGCADDVHDAGLKALFAEAEGHPMDFIVGRDILEHLEKVMDRFEDVANEVQGIVIDHA